MAEVAPAEQALVSDTGSPLRAVFWAELCFFTGITVCVLIDRHGLSVNKGLSYYGVQATTLVPYCTALTGSALLLVRAVRLLPAYAGRGGVLPLPERRVRAVRRTLPLIAALLLTLEVTPFTLNTFFNWSHMLVGAGLFLSQLWLVVRLAAGTGLLSWLLVGAQTLGGVVSAAALPREHGYLLHGQLIFQVAFAAFLIRWLRDHQH